MNSAVLIPDAGKTETTSAPSRVRKVLHVGCGPPIASKLFQVFRTPEWQEVRLDIDERVRPDIAASMVDMHQSIPAAEYDAVWSSHNLEHLESHEVSIALKEFVRILLPTGFALITCPDLAEICRMVAGGRLEDTLYSSPAGEITPLDMLFGHRKSLEAGNHFMRHKTGFSEERLGRLLVEAGFSEVRTVKGKLYDIWALALMADAKLPDVQALFNGVSLEFFGPRARDIQVGTAAAISEPAPALQHNSG